MQIDGSGRVQLVQSMPVLRPDEQVLQLMLDGWRNQQLSRNLQFATIDQRLGMVQRFINHVNFEHLLVVEKGFDQREWSVNRN